MPSIGAVIKEAILSIFKTLLEPFINILTDIVQTGVDIILYTPVPKRCVEGASDSYPDCPTVVALVQKPANGPWPSVYEAAWTKAFPTAVTVLFILYLVLRVVETIPAISRKKTHQVRTGIFGTLVVLPFSWSFGAATLVLFDGLAKALAPNPDEFTAIITAQLTALIGAVASPGGNFLAMGVGGIDAAIIIGAVLAYLFRILFLLFVMQYIHLFAAIYLLDVPVLKGIVTKIFETFIAMSFLPLLVSGMFDFATTLFLPEGNLTIIGGLGAFVKAIIAMVLPIASLGLYYLALKGAMLNGMSKALGKVESAASGTTVGELGDASSDEYGGFVEEKATQLEERVQQGAQATARKAATKSKRGAIAAGKASAYAAENPHEARQKTTTAVKTTPRKAKCATSTVQKKTKSRIESNVDRALSAYDNAPSSVSETMQRLGVVSRDLDDVGRQEVGRLGKPGDESQNLAGRMTETESDTESGLSVSRTLGSVEQASSRSVESLVEEVRSGDRAPETLDPDEAETMTEDEIEDLFEDSWTDTDGVDAAETDVDASTNTRESDSTTTTKSTEASRTQQDTTGTTMADARTGPSETNSETTGDTPVETTEATTSTSVGDASHPEGEPVGESALDKEVFDRAVEKSDLSREGMKILLQNVKEENGEKAAERVAKNASYFQLARESGRKQAHEHSRRSQSPLGSNRSGPADD